MAQAAWVRPSLHGNDGGINVNQQLQPAVPGLGTGAA